MSITRPLTRPLTSALTRAITDPGVGGGAYLPQVVASAPLGLYGFSDFSTLYQDEAGATPVTAVGQTVKRIHDSSNNGRHVTNATGWVLAEDANGALYLTMDGTSTFSCAMAPTAYPLTMMGVFRTTDAAAGAMSLWQSNTQYKVLNKQATAREWRAIDRNAGTMNAVGTVETSADTQLLSAIFRTATLDLSDNGLLLASNANSNAFGTPSTFYIGRTRALDGIMAGRFYGCAIWAKELSAAESRAAYGYFREQGGWNGALVAVGDSFTLNTTDGLTVPQFHPYLTAADIGATAINAASSGSTTGNVVARAAVAAAAAPFRIAVIYVGTNDSSAPSTVQASPTPTSTVFALAAGKGARYAAGALIDVGGEQAEVLSVATDTLTSTAPLSGGAPATGVAVSLKTVENIVKAKQTLNAPRTLVVGQHYLNFGAGTGDTTGAQQVAAAALRTIQQAAAVAAGAVYVDLYAYMRQLIIDGAYVQGDDTAWHVGVGDPHLNVVGEGIISDAITAAITAQGWA